MSKYWKVGNRDDTLFYYVLAPNKEMATKVVEDLMGPMNPSRRLVLELPDCPEGYAANGFESQILTDAEEGGE